MNCLGGMKQLFYYMPLLDNGRSWRENCFIILVRLNIKVDVLCTVQFVWYTLRRRYSCAETTLTDANCTTEWSRRDKTYARTGGTRHSSATTITECQKACEFKPSCVAVDWRWSRNCFIYTNRHQHQVHANSIHYELVSRCNITSGQCHVRLLFIA